MNNTTIRALKAAEAAQCARRMSQTDPWLTLRRDYDVCLTILNDPELETHVAVIDSQIQGFVVICLRGAFVGYIKCLCVVPEHRNRGIGTQLLKFAEDRIFRRSPNVFLCVSSFNKNAQRLYAKLGYDYIGELRDYVVKGHSEYLLRKSTGPLETFAPET